MNKRPRVSSPNLDGFSAGASALTAAGMYVTRRSRASGHSELVRIPREGGDPVVLGEFPGVATVLLAEGGQVFVGTMDHALFRFDPGVQSPKHLAHLGPLVPTSLVAVRERLLFSAQDNTRMGGEAGGVGIVERAGGCVQILGYGDRVLPLVPMGGGYVFGIAGGAPGRGRGLQLVRVTDDLSQPTLFFEAPDAPPALGLTTTNDGVIVRSAAGTLSLVSFGH